MITIGSKERRAHQAGGPTERVPALVPVPSSPSRSALERLRGQLREREHRAAAAALAQEHRRIAAEVHDLVMQDLALALATARQLAEGPDATVEAQAVVDAAERALNAARGVVEGLTDRDREPVVQALEQSVRKAAKQTPLNFFAAGVSAGEQPDEQTLATLVHIGREAVNNAVKHARPSAIEVVLVHEDEWQLLVRDDGAGFDAGRVTEAGAGGFGLQSMSRQADALGGSLRVSSAAGSGTTVEARLP